MNNTQFQAVFDYQIDRSVQVLTKKADEYADDVDRLRNFVQAAYLQGCTPRQALAGMMAKHTVSIYDMALSTDRFSEVLWDEKITDHINYLILLRAIVAEEDNTLNPKEN